MRVTEVRVPDIGDFKNIPVIEVLVKPGAGCRRRPYRHARIREGDAGCARPEGGSGVAVDVAAGSRVSCGTLLLTLSTRTGVVGSASRVSARSPRRRVRRPAVPRTGV